MIDPGLFEDGLVALAEIFGKELSIRAAQLYHAALADLENDAWERAVVHAAQELRFMPRPSELRELAVDTRALAVAAPDVAQLLAGLFCGRLNADTRRTWGAELEHYPLEDVVAGVRDHARHTAHPNFADCVERIETIRRARATRELQRLDRLALPANASPDPQQEARIDAARKAAAAHVDALASRLDINAPREAPPARALVGRTGHETMTSAELERRKRVLADQAVELLREGA